jgi:hypothetical protein
MLDTCSNLSVEKERERERERERAYGSVTTLFFWFHSDKLKIGCLCQQLSHGSSWAK